MDNPANGGAINNDGTVADGQMAGRRCVAKGVALAVAHSHAGPCWPMLARGCWNGIRIISKYSIDDALNPSPVNPRYGSLWWLDTDGKAWAWASPRHRG